MNDIAADNARQSAFYAAHDRTVDAGPDPEPNVGFYVTVRKHGQSGKLLGPYDTHAEALAHVDRAKAKAAEVDPWSHFYEFGTARVSTVRPLPPGLLNGLIGLHPLTGAA
jgi:hypothetical protein